MAPSTAPRSLPAPALTPSTWSCTPTTPTLSAAFAVMVIVPETVAPAAGEVTETDGGVVSLNTVTVTVFEVQCPPSWSRATAVMLWVPFVAVRVFHGISYGALPSSAPRLAPSILNCTPATRSPPTPTMTALALTGTVPVTWAPLEGAVTVTTRLSEPELCERCSRRDRTQDD